MADGVGGLRSELATNAGNKTQGGSYGACLAKLASADGMGKRANAACADKAGLGAKQRGAWASHADVKDQLRSAVGGIWR